MPRSGGGGGRVGALRENRSAFSGGQAGAIGTGAEPVAEAVPPCASFGHSGRTAGADWGEVGWAAGQAGAAKAVVRNNSAQGIQRLFNPWSSAAGPRRWTQPRF